MEIGEKIGIDTIMTANRESCKELQKKLFEINDKLFGYKHRYISQKCAKRLLSFLAEAGKDLNSMILPLSARPKQEEMLGIVREMYKSLNKYYKLYRTSESDEEEVQKVINYEVYKLADIKKKGTLLQDSIKYLEEIKEIYEDYIKDENYENVNPDNLMKFNAEIINMIYRNYSFDDE